MIEKHVVVEMLDLLVTVVGNGVEMRFGVL
jgi:hypothetical protein